MHNEGIVMVYTGNGKGKTTAALGMALRAIGHGKKVIMLQFMKGSRNYGEVKAVEKYLPQFRILQFGRDEFVDKDNPERIDMELAQRAVKAAREILENGEYDLVILDEINVALDFKLVTKEQVMELIDLKPAATDLILTGRYAHPEIRERADLVSEVEEIKHHYQKGVEARAGVEF